MSAAGHAQALIFTIHADGRAYEETILVRTAVIAGWTGRDKEALEKHIKELEELGVPRPASTPIYYRVAAARLRGYGVGPLAPVASNDAEPGRAKNRRVELVLMPDVSEMLDLKQLI